VLFELIKNSKEKIDTIATKCGFSKQKVVKILKEMKTRNLIWGYTAVFDEEQIGLKHFIFMAKKTSNKIDDKTLDTIVSRQLESRAAELGIIVESSCYVHGEYDWVLTATAENVANARKFSDILMTQYPNVFKSIIIMQTLICMRKNYVLNPERTKLKKYL
jgi:DNA-binding Lrp family transcriptional regulator